MFSVSCPKDKCDARRRSWTSPIATAAASWSSPTGGGCRVGATSPTPSGAQRSGSGRTASRTSRQLRAVYGDLLDERFYADVERDQAERATMSLLMPPQMVNTMVPDRGADHRGDVRRPGPPLHAAGVHRPRPGLAEPPAGQPRLAARGGDVGGRGADPPLPDEGARRAARRPARSTAGTAPGWTWSATPRPPSTSTSSC